MTIKVTELLKLFTKAKQLGFSINVHEDKDGDYVIRIFELFSPENFNETVVITQEGEGTDIKGDLGFYDMMDVLDGELEEQKQKEIKEQKRQELIARLTDEEKELLNLK
jgi:RNA binding exosome subunit